MAVILKSCNIVTEIKGHSLVGSCVNFDHNEFMIWKTPLKQGKLLKRYKRFFADVELAELVEFADGEGGKKAEIVVAHVANTGSLKSVIDDLPTACLVSPASNPDRKLKWTLEAVKSSQKGWIGVNTSLPSMLVKEAFEKKVFKAWADFSEIKSEVKINAETRLDFCLIGEKNRQSISRYVEVKNVTLKAEKSAQFPDAVTTRGLKHIHELMNLKAKNIEVELLFIVQRTDCEYFSPADEIDEDYAAALRAASKKGLIINAAIVELDKKGAEITGEMLEIKL